MALIDFLRTATATGATTGAGPLGLGPGLVDDGQVPEEAAVQHLDGLGQLFPGRHLDEPKASGPAGELIRDDPDRLHRPGLLEQLAQVFFRAWNDRLPTKSFAGIWNLLPRSGPSTFPRLSGGAFLGTPARCVGPRSKPVACPLP